MSCLITGRKTDGSEVSSLECLATCDVVSRVVEMLHDDDVTEVVVRKVSLDEARDLQAFKEILERMQSQSQIEAMRKVYEAITEARRKR